jgi:N-acetylglutamate synthase-like GNAT family acetyltransferase
VSEDPPASIRAAASADADAVRALLEAEDLEAAFAPDEFLVAEAGSELVGCARLKPLPDGARELASVAVAPHRRGEGLGRALVQAALEGVDAPVHALCLEPGFFEELGFRPVDETHPALADKAQRCCRDREWLPMVRETGD